MRYLDITENDRLLIQVAIEVVTKNYREERHMVGAAVLCASGKIYAGVNVESCGYGPYAEPIAIGAAIIRGDTRLSYKKIKQKLGLKNVSLAAPEQVKELTGSDVGHVALANPGLKTIVDERVIEVETIYGGTGVPNHTLRINPKDVVKLTQAQVFDFAESKEKG